MKGARKAPLSAIDLAVFSSPMWMYQGNRDSLATMLLSRELVLILLLYAALGAADAAEGAVTLFFIGEALGIHGWTGALLLAHLLIRRLAWGADYMLLRAMVSDLVRSGGNGFAAMHYALFNCCRAGRPGRAHGARLYRLPAGYSAWATRHRFAGDLRAALMPGWPHRPAGTAPDRSDAVPFGQLISQPLNPSSAIRALAWRAMSSFPIAWRGVRTRTKSASTRSRVSDTVTKPTALVSHQRISRLS